MLPYRTKVKWRITQKDLQLFRSSPYAPEWKKQENKPHPKPYPSLPQGEGTPHNHLKHSKMELQPLGEGMGRGLRKQQQL